jgi:hypothetical protein
MRNWAIGIVVWCIVGIAAAGTITDATPARSVERTASPAASPGACPVTRPNGVQPPESANIFGRGNGDYGTGALWTSLWVWGEGVVLVPETHVNADGSLGPMKWPWWRGVPGPLVVTGRRLDAPAPPLQAFAAGGERIDRTPEPSAFEVRYSESAFHPTGLVFPTGGCWEITARVGEHTLTFVTLVVPPAEAATPVASTRSGLHSKA